MLEDIKEVEARIKALKPAQRNIMASHIWWKLANKNSVEEMAGIKAMINYNATPQSPDVVEATLHEFGFSSDYAERNVKSLRTLLRQRWVKK